MSKPFTEVFPKLILKEDNALLMNDTDILRLTAPKYGGLLRIYLHSTHLIPRRIIGDTEKEIERQLFPGVPMVVRIFENYDLSEAYTTKVIAQEYKDSILMQLKSRSPLDHSLFRDARMEFEEDDVIILTLRDNVISRERGKDIGEFLENLYDRRFNKKITVTIRYEMSEKAPDRKRSRGTSSAADTVPATDSPIHIKDESGAGIPSDGGYGDAFGDDAMYGASRDDGWDMGDSGDRDDAADQMTDERDNPAAKEASAAPSQPEKASFIKSDDKDVLFGRFIAASEAVTTIAELDDIPADVVIRGRIIKCEDRETRPREGKKSWLIKSLDVTDDTDTIKVKMFIPLEEAHLVPKELSKKGSCLRIKGQTGVDKFDHELTMGNVTGIMKIPEFAESRVDDAPEGEKRVELHCHTKMSDMDAVSTVSSIVKRAYEWGHPAIAITDHGVVQSFPDAFHTWQDLYKAANNKRKDQGLEPIPKEEFFKIIYGVEAYLVDDESTTVINDKGQSLDEAYVVFDLETTGFSPVQDEIIEIGAVKVSGGFITDRFSSFVNPRRPIPYRIEKLTSISDRDVADAPFAEDILPRFVEFCEGAVMVAHNAAFDMGFMNAKTAKYDIPFDKTSVDTLGISRLMLPTLSKHKLDTIAKKLKIDLRNHHRAVDDAEATAQIFLKFIDMLKKDGIEDLSGITAAEIQTPAAIAKKPSYHAIILAANETGRVNLYRLISASHLKYFHGRPRVPKSLIKKHREGLILGSACEQGELYMAFREEKPDDVKAAIASFYDYLEIQPVGNNMFLLGEEKAPGINTIEDLQEINRKITELGDRLQKPVCATCDVHFLDPKDEIYRRIIMGSRGFSDADNQPPLYLHTTKEMLEEFAYLGPEKSREVVIDNPALIASRVEQIAPVRPDKCAPVIPGSDETLRKICESKAAEMYGTPLPAPVTERLERELHSIITNGFAVMYIIAQKLVWKSMEDGYLVGSRGSVGSSFVATMSGITEVNPLPPHYYCKNCHYSDFDSEDVKSYFGRAGCDMPDKICPVCKEKLSKDGFDIPFETFLGFNGDKEPDIDLNFSGEYQSKAHKYTEVIFGAGQTYRAGTVGTVADKTAFGFVKKYYEEHGIIKRGSEIDRIASGIEGIRRSTGQHPGGIIVLPLGEEIDSFTPVQHPADDTTTDIVTTHFDYHSIDHNLLKLDILGHADPTMIRRLSVLTDTDPLTIPLDDQRVMSLFKSTEVLGVKPEDIGGTRLGTRGVPEFGTDFAIGMLIDTKPECLSDLVRIAGLAHGTDVWLGNAKDLILSGTATISTAICTRDDIMTYLIGMGVESALSFKIMESVRKGKGLTPDMESAMRAQDVPDWYIDSCKKIKYMFPKAHAAAYVMMAWRIAWYKINYPLEYYTAYFSIRASAFSYDKMCRGLNHLRGVMAEIDRRRAAGEKVSAQEENAYDDMQIVQEMYVRGFDFMPIDIYKAHARDFRIIDGKIMPSFSSIDGLGDKAAEGVYQAAKGEPFLSKDDLRTRSGLTKTNIETMTELGLLEGLPETNQMSLFDFLGAV